MPPFNDSIGERICSAIERIALSYERIADSQERSSRNLEGLYAIAERFYRKQFPDRPPVREAKVTKVQSDQEKVREQLQRSENMSTQDWIDELVGSKGEFVGEREREWLQNHPEAGQGGSAEEKDSGTASSGSERRRPAKVSTADKPSEKSKRRAQRSTRSNAVRV